MKCSIKKKVTLEVTVNSSELTMMNQGGKHTLQIESLDSNGEKVDLDFSPYDVLEITVQLQRDEFGRFDFINNEAARHRKQCDETSSK